MSTCPNISSPEWQALEAAVGRKEAFRDWMENSGEIRTPDQVIEKINLRATTKVSESLDDELINGFFKDFNITVNEYNSLKDDLGYDAYTMADFLTKTVVREKGQPISYEAAYFAFNLLGKKNDKMRSSLRYLINKWDKFDDRFNYHKAKIKDKEGFIKNKEEWHKKINDLVVLDFLAEKLNQYYKNPTNFTKIKDVKWTKEDFTRWEKLLRWLENLIERYIVSNKKSKEKLDSIALSIADDILTRNYTYFNYNLSEDVIQKYYKNSIESNPLAKELVELGQKNGLIVTGSLALRRVGTVYRSTSELIHDVDFVVPYDLVNSDTNKETLETIIRHQGIDPFASASVAKPYVKNFDWYKKLKEQYPSLEITNAFYGKDTGFNSLSVQAVINGEFYKEDGSHTEKKTIYKKDPITKETEKSEVEITRTHKKGDFVQGTGTAVDFFIRLAPFQEEHENYFKVWKEIFMAKLAMGREKDYMDWKAFVPYVKSLDSYNFNYGGFRHINWKENAQNNALDDTAIAFYKPGNESVYHDMLRNWLEQNFDINSYGIITQDLSAEEQSRINQKIKSLFVPEDWHVKRAKSGNYYIAGYKNFNVFSSDYYPRIAYLKEDIVRAQADEFQSTLLPGNHIELDAKATSKTKGYEIAKKLADAFSMQLGVKYEIIDSAQAKAIIGDAWNGEPAFYANDIVYFIGDKFDVDKVLHEFSHPLLRGIKKSNPTLFSNLVKKVLATEEGKALAERIKERYKYTNEHPLFEEELLVQSLAKILELNRTKTKPSAGFAKFIKDLLYAMKQILRKMFGTKVKVENLNPNTNLNELADMLAAGNLFDISTEEISENDVIAFMKEFANENETLEKLSKEDPTGFKTTTDRFLNMISKQLKLLEKNEDFETLADIFNVKLKEEAPLGAIKSALSQYRSEILRKIEQAGTNIDYTRQHVEAFINSLVQLEKLAKMMDNHLDDLSKNPDNKDNLMKINNYDKMINWWSSFINEVDAFAKNVPADNPLRKKVSTIKTFVDDLKRKANEIRLPGMRDFLYGELEAMNKNIVDYYTTLIEDLKKRGTNERTIKYYEKELEDTKLTPTKIEQFLKGDLGDAHGLNHLLEGYMYSQDPIVAGFAKFVKDNTTEYLTNAYQKYNDFINDTNSTLKAAGFNPINVGDFGRQLVFKDKIAVMEDGNLVTKEVFTFLNDHQNWREALRRMDHEIHEAKLKADASGDPEDLNNYYILEQKKDKHMRTYFHQYYRDEFYKAEEVFDDVIGQKAFAEWKRITGELAAHSRKRFDETSPEELEAIIDPLLVEYRLLFSLTDLDGNKKTGEAYEKAIRLRKYRKDTADFFEFIPKEGMFQQAYLNYESQLEAAGIPRTIIQDNVVVPNPNFTAAMTSWLNRNTVKKVKPEYYTIVKAKYAELERLLAKFRETQGGKDLYADLAVMHDAASLYRDEDGEPDASQMDKDLIQRAKEAQEAVNEFRSKFAGFSGLTKAEMEEISDYYDRVEMAQEGYAAWPTQEQKARIGALLSKKKAQGLDPASKARVIILLNQLKDLQSKEPTEYYLDIFNNYLSQVNTDELEKATGSRIATKENMELILNGNLSGRNQKIINQLLKQNAKFKTWFDNNHISKEFWHKESGEMLSKYERVGVWSVSRPRQKKYMETTTIKDGTGNDIILEGVPSRQYFQRSVKPSLINEQVVGKTIDNRGRYLPKLDTELAPGVQDLYTNQEYQTLKRAYENDPSSKEGKLFKALELLKKHHLSYQEGLTNPKKLYMDIPRYRKDELEILQSRKEGNPLKIWITGVRDRFRKAKDDLEFGYNADKEAYRDAEFTVVKTDMFNNQLSNIPITGIAEMELDQVSMDITQGMMRYMLGTEKQKQLMKIQPVARGLQSLLNDPRYQNKSLNDITRKNLLNLGQRTYVNRKGKSVRAAAIDAMIERDFEGQQMSGVTKDLKWLNALSGVLFSRASFGFFALNVPSALKNQLGALFQGGLEAMAGTHMNRLSYGKGIKDSIDVMGKVSTELYQGKTKSLPIQMMDIFDMVHGRMEERFGEIQSRTLTADLVKGAPNFSWLYNFRKWTELQATLSLSFGMMNHKKIPRIVDGVETTISYRDAWELKNGKIKLKDGIDPEWDINGKEFKNFKNLMHQINERAQGAYAKLAQPEAQRFLLYRMVSFLRKYFTTMLMERWGFRGSFWNPKLRYDVGTNSMTQGYYITVIQSLRRWLSSNGKALPIMTPIERRAFIKFGTEISSLVALVMFYNWWFDWDPDDEEKYEKLRKKSGPLPFPFVADDPEHPFHPMGWTSNQMLQLLMQVRAENDQWLPFPGFGLDNYAEQLSLKSFAYGPTIESYVKLLQDMYLMASGDERSQYMRDIGPYDWQKAESEKIWNHAFKMVGVTGTTMDPVLAIKNFQSWQQTTGFR